MRLFILSGLLTMAAVAAPPAGEIRIPGSYALAPKLQRLLSHDTQDFYRRQLARALYLATEVVPFPDAATRFPWETRSDVVMKFYATFASDSWTLDRRISRNQISGMSLQGVEGKVHVTLYYLFDRIYFNPDLTPKAGAFVELASTIAFQFGTLSHYLQYGAEALKEPRGRQAQRARLINGHNAVLTFLNNMARNPHRTALDPASRARIPELIMETETSLILLGCHRNQSSQWN